MCVCVLSSTWSSEASFVISAVTGRLYALPAVGPAYVSELLHVYTPSRTLRSSSDTRMLKIQQYNTKLMAFTTCLTLDPTFGIHSHKTLDTAQPCPLLRSDTTTTTPTPTTTTTTTRERETERERERPKSCFGMPWSILIFCPICALL